MGQTLTAIVARSLAQARACGNAAKRRGVEILRRCGMRDAGPGNDGYAKEADLAKLRSLVAQSVTPSPELPLT